jgi:hypothetical protein
VAPDDLKLVEARRARHKRLGLRGVILLGIGRVDMPEVQKAPGKDRM